MPLSTALQPSPTHHEETVLASAPNQLIQTTISNSIVVHNIALPSAISIPDIHFLILDAFDNIIAPTISSPNPRHRFIKIFLSRTLLSNAVRHILALLSNNVNNITIADLNILTNHAQSLSGF